MPLDRCADRTDPSVRPGRLFVFYPAAAHRLNGSWVVTKVPAYTTYGGIVTECWDCVTNDFQCCPNASVGNHPAGIKPWDGTRRLSTDADETDQFCPPQSSFEPRHNEVRTGTVCPGQPVASVGSIAIKP